jgi:hypothetical protein
MHSRVIELPVLRNTQYVIRIAYESSPRCIMAPAASVEPVEAMGDGPLPPRRLARRLFAGATAEKGNDARPRRNAVDEPFPSAAAAAAAVAAADDDAAG